MALNDDLTTLKNIEEDIADNKVINFAYKQNAYTENDADGVEVYDRTKENNIPLADLDVVTTSSFVADRGLREKASSLIRKLVNHIFGRASYNLNKIHDNFVTILSSLINSLGTANGIATLDNSGRVPSSQLPLDSMEYKGSWNASTNTPTLADGEGTSGDTYIVSVAGTQNLGSGNISFLVGDRVFYDGSIWKRLANGEVDTINNVPPDTNGNVSLTKNNFNLEDVVNTGDSSSPEENGTDKFTTGGAFSFFAGCTTVAGWLGMIFCRLLGKIWTKSRMYYYSNPTFNDVYYANGIWVACGTFNGLWWSTDGQTWVRGTGSNTTRSFYCIYYANGIWVAGSQGSSSIANIWYSSDGKNWTTTSSPKYNAKCTSVYYANGIWVASFATYGLWYSTDGITWTRGFTTNYSFNKVYYANGIWVACSSSHGLYYSTDGMAWTQVTGAISSYSFNTAYYANNLWVAGSTYDGLWYSTDSTTWFQCIGGTTYTFNTVYYANGIWVAGSSIRGLWWSTDGETWTQSNITSGSFNDTYSANGIWVAGSIDSGLYYSTDGKSWTYSTDGTTYTFNTVYYANGIWVAGCYSANGLLYSTDGQTWTQSTLLYDYNDSMYSACYANGIWVAGGEGGTIYSDDGKNWRNSMPYETNYIYYDKINNIWLACTEENGVCWSENGKDNWNTDSSVSSYSFNYVDYSGFNFVACSNSNGLWTSGSGKYWSQITGETSTMSFTFALCANNMWVACSTSNGLWYCNDITGDSWTQGTGGTTYGFNHITYANGLWVAGSINNGLWYSTDGKVWTQGTGGTTYSFRRIKYANGIWVAVSNSANGGIWYSTDGMSWTQTTDVTANLTLRQVNYAFGIWIATSTTGVYYSYNGINWAKSTVEGSVNAPSSFVLFSNGMWLLGGSYGLYWSSLDNADTTVFD